MPAIECWMKSIVLRASKLYCVCPYIYINILQAPEQNRRPSIPASAAATHTRAHIRPTLHASHIPEMPRYHFAGVNGITHTAPLSYMRKTATTHVQTHHTYTHTHCLLFLSVSMCCLSPNISLLPGCVLLLSLFCLCYDCKWIADLLYLAFFLKRKYCELNKKKFAPGIYLHDNDVAVAYVQFVHVYMQNKEKNRERERERMCQLWNIWAH